MKSVKRHFIEYGLFLAVLALFLVFFVVFRTDRNLLKLISGIISSVYVLWGIIHSVSEGRLTPAVALEYFLFGILAFLLLFVALSFE